MASLYKRKGSSFWWISYNRGGRNRRESTGLKIGNGHATRRAKELCAEKSLDEARHGRGSADEAWARWVPTYLVQHTKAPRSLERYKVVWNTLESYLVERRVFIPRHLTRDHCLDYVKWRANPDRSKGKYPTGINNVKNELSILGMIVSEAVKRGYVSANPCKDLDIAGTRPARKPEFADEHLGWIEAAIAKVTDPAKREFFENTFAIARYQGCRMAETRLNPLTDVEIAPDGSRGTITFRIKGGRDHSAPLHPKLIPLFQRLRAENRTTTYAWKGNPRFAWYALFRDSGIRAKLLGACFHCLRVTAVTRLARAGVPEARAMQYIGHASVLIHRVYQRHRPEDLSACLTALD